MTLLICLPLILVVVALAARRWFVTTRQDIRSIESHRTNLVHLEHLAPGEEDPAEGAPTGSAHVRIVASPGATPEVRPMVWGRLDGRPPSARPRWHAPLDEPVRSRYEKARIEARARAEATEDPADRPAIVITDAAVSLPTRPKASNGNASGPAPELPVQPSPVPAAVAAIAGGGAGPSVTARARRHRRPRPEASAHRHGRRILAAAAGLIVAGAGATIALRNLHPGHPSALTRHTASGPAPAPTTSAPPVTVRTAPPATSPPALTATSTSATDAIYTVTAGSLQISLLASAPCWVELRTGSPAGPVAFEGTLQAGAAQTFTAGSGLWVRLGDPAGVQMRVNGSTVALPAASNPFNVTVTSA